MRCNALFALAACIFAVSCGGNEPAATDAKSNQTRVLIPANLPGTNDVANGANAQAARISAVDAPVAPANAQWTLYCKAIVGPGHVERANDLKSRLIKGTGLKGWYLIHGEDQSSLYFGYYAEIGHQSKEGVQAQADKRTIDNLKDNSGERPFRACHFVELNAPDPDAPPEWNLANAPAGAFWSVQIGAYMNHPDRKKAAVETVREARAKGIEAYYYHGPVVSSVCIGSWPIEAVEDGTSIGQGKSDGSRGSATTPDLLVLDPSIPLPKGEIRNEKGEKVETLSQQLKILDKTLIATLETYPRHHINGEERYRKGKNSEKRPEPTFLVKVPGRNPGGAEPDTDGQFEETSSFPSFLRPTESDNSNRPGQTRLRSLGDN